MAQVEDMDRAITTWYQHWELVYQGRSYRRDGPCTRADCTERGLSSASFQRSSLSLQRDYAFIIASGNLIGHLVKGSPDGHELREIVDLTLDRLMRLISFIAENEAYSWHLRWAPTYSAIFPVFIGKHRERSEDSPRQGRQRQTCIHALTPS